MDADKKVISELIKRQMAILGKDITMSRVKNVIGLAVDENGEVVSIDRDAQSVLSDLTNQFVELSGLIVKKTMESILAGPPAPPAPTPEERQALAAHKELEELNKMLNTGS
jgi:hypothetical protein